MSTQSDLVIALKKNLVDLANKNPVLARFLSSSDSVNEQDEGTIYVFKAIKWPTFDDTTRELEIFLFERNDDFLIRENCYDHPTSDDWDIGCWDDNPWNIQKIIKADIEYEFFTYKPEV